MRKVTLVAVLFAGATALADEKFELRGAAAKGAETYRRHCESCHGAKGDGNGPAGAVLNPKPSNFTDAKRAAEIDDQYLYDIIKGGGLAKGRSPLMPSWKVSLGEQTIRDAAAFVRTFASGSSAAVASAPGKLPPAVALVWGGGKTTEAAQEHQHRWLEELDLAPEVVLAAGFPKTVASQEVAGLNPGFHIVLLGVCEPSEAVELRRFLKGLYPFLYEKPVTGVPVDCPHWNPEDRAFGLAWKGLDSEEDNGSRRTWTVTSLAATGAGKTPLNLVRLARETLFSGGLGVESISRVVVVARDRRGNRLDSMEEGATRTDADVPLTVDPKDTNTRSNESGCSLQAEARSSGFALLRSCEQGNSKQTITFDPTTGKLVATQPR